MNGTTNRWSRIRRASTVAVVTAALMALVGSQEELERNREVELEIRRCLSVPTS